MAFSRASGSTRGPRIDGLWCTKETQAFGREQVSVVPMVCFNRCWFITFIGNWLRPNISQLSSSIKQRRSPAEVGPTGSLEPPLASKTRSRRTRGRDLAAQLGALHGEEDDGEGGGGPRSRGSDDQSSTGGDGGRGRGGGHKSLAILASRPSQSFKVLICRLKTSPHFLFSRPSQASRAGVRGLTKTLRFI